MPSGTCSSGHQVNPSPSLTLHFLCLDWDTSVAALLCHGDLPGGSLLQIDLSCTVEGARLVHWSGHYCDDSLGLMKLKLVISKRCLCSDLRACYFQSRQRDKRITGEISSMRLNKGRLKTLSFWARDFLCFWCKLFSLDQVVEEFSRFPCTDLCLAVTSLQAKWTWIESAFNGRWHILI